MRQLISLFALALILLISSAATAQAPGPLTLGYQGHLTDLTRQPINGERDITFRFYNARVGGEVVWEETLRSVLVEDGDFSVNLGLNTPLPINESPDTPLFMTIEVQGDLELSRCLPAHLCVRSLDYIVRLHYLSCVVDCASQLGLQLRSRTATTNSL